LGIVSGNGLTRSTPPPYFCSDLRKQSACAQIRDFSGGDLWIKRGCGQNLEPEGVTLCDSRFQPLNC
jgi:hypothetical protein